MAEITILDVGHGNCSVIQDSQHVLIIDAPLRDIELKTMVIENGIYTLDAVLISHADADHIGGLLTLLTDVDISIRHIYLNSESQRDTKLWDDLRFAVRDARRRDPELRVHVELTTAKGARPFQ